MKKYLALFDLDGTLFDTSDVNYYAYKDALSSFGVELTRDYFISKCFGKNYKEFLPVILGGSEHIEDVHKEKKNLYCSYINKANINSHLFRIIDSIKQEYYLGIVTTASRKNTIEILEYFGYKDYFDYIVTQESIKNMKPNPEGYLTIMNHFGIDAFHTIIFEDSDVGIKAARATGASVLVVNRL